MTAIDEYRGQALEKAEGMTGISVQAQGLAVGAAGGRFVARRAEVPAETAAHRPCCRKPRERRSRRHEGKK
jgi:hypothetical protein